MPISFALLLCIPIGFLFFFIARLTCRFVLGRYESYEHRATLAFSIFGALLIPDIWTIGCLQEGFPKVPEMLISSPVFLFEGFALATIFRLFTKRGSDGDHPGNGLGIRR